MKRVSVIGLTVIIMCMPLRLLAQTRLTLTVDELFNRIENNSNSLRLQKTGVEVASEALKDAKSQVLPDIKTSLSFSYNGNVWITDRNFSNASSYSSPHFGNSFSIEARQTIYSGGALTTGIRLAQLKKQQAEVSVNQKRMEERLLALGQYLDLFKMDNAILVYNQNILLTDILIKNIKDKQNQGMALKNDLTRYELQMEMLRLDLRKMQDNREIVNHNLCNTLSLDKTMIIPDTTLIYTFFSAETENIWQEKAIAQSPTLQLSDIEIKQSEQQIKMAKSEMLPKLALVAGDNFWGPFTYDIPPINKNINVWYFGIGINYSLSSLFKNNKNIQKANVILKQSYDTHALLAETLDNQVQEAYTLYKQSFVELRTQEKSVELAVQNYKVMKERYLNQLALVTDMIDASNVRLKAELQEVDAKINIVYAYYKLKYIAGEI